MPTHPRPDLSGDPDPVKLIAFLLWKDADRLEQALDSMRRLWGKIDHTGPDRVFDLTDYYTEEMGSGLRRRMISLARLVPSESLATAKLAALDIEKKLRHRSGRTVNVDVGYLDTHKVVLASIKRGGLKIHIGQGVYADLVCRYSRGQFHPLEWTFADFKEGRYDDDLARVRTRYKEQLADGRTAESRAQGSGS